VGSLCFRKNPRRSADRIGFAKKAVLSVEGLKTILATELKGKWAKPEEFFDSSFVAELDQSGFTESLYKKQ